MKTNIFILLGLILITASIIIRRADKYTVYEITIQGTHEGCPCAYEVWKARVPVSELVPNGDSYDYYGSDHWDIVYRKNDCPE